MTPEEFESRARSCKTRQDLEQLKSNALAKNKIEFAKIAQDLLNERFPIVSKKSGGATPSTVTFLGKRQEFSSGKDGYVWLVDQFGLYHKNLFTDYANFHKQRKSRGSHLAKKPKDLFPVESNRADNKNNYAAVVGGWYVDINLNHAGKFELLLQLGYLSKLEYPTDWNFEITGSTEELVARQQGVVWAEKVLQELLSM